MSELVGDPFTSLHSSPNDFNPFFPPALQNLCSNLYFMLTYAVDLGYPKNQMISVDKCLVRGLFIITTFWAYSSLCFNIATLSRLRLFNISVELFGWAPIATSTSGIERREIKIEFLSDVDPAHKRAFLFLEMGKKGLTHCFVVLFG